MPEYKKRFNSEILAVAVVQSVLVIGVAAAIVYYFGAGFAVPKKQGTRTLAATSNCPGTKLNYPRKITQKFPNGKKVTFRYNCIQTGFIATSYDGNCKGCSGRTRLTNEPVTWGICAVDTDVIRSFKDTHSKFYVPGYGPCKAADTGGLVKGKKIDLGFEDVRHGWWSKRETNIYTLVK